MLERSPASHAVPTGLDRRAITERLPVLLLAVGCAAQLALAIHLSDGMWFVRDDWDYLMKRGTVPDADRGWFAPYGGHWVTGPIILFRLLFAFFGMKTYLPYLLMSVFMHLATTAVVFVLLQRIGLSRWMALALAWIVLFPGLGAEAFLWDGSMPLIGSILLGLVALVVCLQSDFARSGLLWAAGLLTLSVMFSGAGITATCFVAVFLLLRRDLRSAVTVSALPALAFLVWYLLIGHTAPDTWADAGEYLQLPSYVWTGLGGAVGGATGVPGIGGVLMLALLLAPFLVRNVPETLRHLAWAGSAAALLQMTLTGIARMKFGVEHAVAGRYAYLVIILLLPGLAVCVLAFRSALVRRGLVPVALVALLLVFLTVNTLDVANKFAQTQRDLSNPWPARVQGILDSVDEGERILTPSPESWIDGDVDARLAATAPIRNALPNREGTPEGRLDAESLFFVGVSAESFGLFKLAEIELRGFDSPFRPGNSCQDYQALVGDPSLVLSSEDGNEIGVKSESAVVKTQVQRGDLVSGTRTWPVEPGKALHIATSAKDAQLIVAFDRGGDYTICTN